MRSCLVAHVLGKANGKTYLVDNRSGAGGSIGTAELTRAQLRRRSFWSDG
ncbi:MAG: hypothetical protein M0R28_21950 [Pigmentiphaga sp.]|nr:hypothetical protein [Pigmentiphaga sp.]